MTKTIRWGILGTGAIAHKFATGLASLPDTELLAVGSRSQAGADAFGEAFAVPRRYPSYDALASDPDIDAVYIATPHSLHKENSLLCLNRAKAVLCEKPLALNFQEAQEMASAAASQHQFLMEAMWTRFLPHMRKVHALIQEGAIGEPRLLQADFGFRMAVDPEHRLYNPELGGGALLDVGIYPVALAHELFGAPAEIKTFGNLGETGVDEEAALMFRHDQGQLALLSTATRLNTPHEATIVGTEGRIHIHHGWWRPTSFSLYQQDTPERFDVPTPLNGYNYEALEVGRCLREGLIESPLMPVSESLEIMKTLDAVRAQWGLRYPAETL